MPDHGDGLEAFYKIPIEYRKKRLDGEAVGISDCVAVNNTVTDVLDAEDLVPQSYVLEVSSPGVERPLKC